MYCYCHRLKHRRHFDIPVVGITGTNGKTTTKELVSAVLGEKFNVMFTQGNFNNDVGVPKTLFRLSPENEIAVVEMGASHPGDIRKLVEYVEPTCGMITNVGRAHLQGFGSFEGVKKTIANLQEQIAQKDKELQALREELDKKDIHIAALDETINNLNTKTSRLTTESSQKSETINAQDKQLNTAWYVFGTKKELKEQHIMEGGKVMTGNFNKSYFTKVDIRNISEIKLMSKSAKLLTTHPSSSYALVRDANKQYTLRITNPQIFWSTSKYLVVLVK